MKRSTSEENGEVKRPFLKQDTLHYGYESTYTTNYTTSSPSTSVVTQPLPGQPPLPPMPPPPPPGAIPPPPPHIFTPVPSQITQMQAWAHAPQWQWITPQTTTFQRDLPLRGAFLRRERFSNNRNNAFNQRNNFHRKNRRVPAFGQQISTRLGLEWQRSLAATAGNEALLNHMSVSLPNQVSQMPSAVIRHADSSGGGDPEVKMVSEEVVVKRAKHRKPMSQSYPSRPWDRGDAERALSIENEYNKTVRAQSLIIKFPDPDLNKDIVREFHSGILNIHFQSPSGPRYCFIQMAKDVDIDEAIRELEKIPFGTGHLKVERKSLRDEDNPTPEEIDPYTLYIGNLPESVNVNEVKNKFPTASRVDVGFAQKMRNTRYAFIRYNTANESISAYKQAHDLMWDTRSIIVRFRRQRGNTCLPGEPKTNVKKTTDDPGGVKNNKESTNNGVKENTSSTKNAENSKSLEAKTAKVQPISSRLGSEWQRNSAATAGNEASLNHTPVSLPKQEDKPSHNQEEIKSRKEVTVTTADTSTIVPTSITTSKTAEQQQPWTPSQSPQIPPASETPPSRSTEDDTLKELLITEIKEEPEDYCDFGDFDDSDMGDDMQTEEEMDDEDSEGNVEDDIDDDQDEEDTKDEKEVASLQTRRIEENPKVQEEPSDHLDQMFRDLENIAGDIGL